MEKTIKSKFSISNMRWILVVTLIGFSATKLEAFTWAEVPLNKEIFPGTRNVVLPCRVSGSYRSINWSGKTSDQEMELLVIKAGENSEPEYWKKGFTVQNGFNLVIALATFEENNGDYRCSVKDTDGTNDYKSATVTILRAPTGPTLNFTSGGITNVNQAFVAGNTYRILCASTQGNPKPKIVWTINEKEIIDKSSANELTLDRKFTKDDHLANFTCSVKNNAITDPKMTKFTANVEYKPVLTVDKDYRVIEGKDASLNCLVDANPSVGDNVKWLKKEGLVQKSASRKLSLTNVNQSEAGVYLCRANNTRGEVEAEATIDVLYPPKITLPNKVVRKEGDPVSIECVVDSNPPPFQIIWLKDQATVSDGPWLNFTAIRREDASFYECKGSNKMNPTQGVLMDTTLGTRTEIAVNYKPGPATIIGSPDVTQGSAIELTCKLTPDAGIPAGTFKWQMKNTSGVLKEFAIVSSTLSINPAEREDEGTYMCWGTNSIGDGEKGEQKVNVNIKPVIAAGSWNEISNLKENEVQNLECVAEGKPIPKITWRKDGNAINGTESNVFTIKEEDAGSEKRKSILKFEGTGRSPHSTKVEPTDYGRYECLASNAGGETIVSTNVRILYKPRMRTNQLKFASQIGKEVDVSCVAEAYPQPAFEWRRNNVKIVNGTQHEIKAPEEVQGEAYPYVYRSVLTIKSVEENDYDDYQCISGNDEPTNKALSDVNVTLARLSKPEAPTNLATDGLKYNSATLRWRSGFNGGKEQRFFLRLTKEAAADTRRRRTAVGEDIAVGVAKVDDPPGKSFEYNITDLDPSQRYNIALEAKNDLGGSGYAKTSFATAPFPVKPAMVPKIDEVVIEDNVLTASVDTSALSDWDLCLKVETTMGEPEDYKPLKGCGGLEEKYNLPAKTRQVRVSVCVEERQSVCCPAEERYLTPPTPWWIWLLVALGGLLFLILFVVLIVCCCRRCRKYEHEKEEKAKMNGSPPDYDNDTAHRKRHNQNYAVDNPAHDIDFADARLHGVYAKNLPPGLTTDLPDGPYIAKPVNVIDSVGGGGEFPPYWPSNNGTMQRPLSSYNPYITPPHLQQQPQHGTFRSGGGSHQNPALMGGPAHQSPYILDYDDDAKKLDGYDSGYSPEDHPVAAPQRQPTQKSGGKRTIYEVVV